MPTVIPVFVFNLNLEFSPKRVNVVGGCRENVNFIF